MSINVSVVIAAYNAESYIVDTIRSVLAQTHKTLEIWVVDDGSTDNTAKVVRSFGDKVNYVRQENAGPGAARNLAFSRCTGTYIAIVDSDDIWHPEKLAKQLRRIEELGADISCTNARIIDGAGHPSGKERRAHVDEQDPIPQFLRHNFITTSSVMVRKSTLDQVGYHRTEPAIFGAEDGELWFRILAEGKPLALVAEPLVDYRVHVGNMSGGFFKHQKVRDYAHSLMYDYMKERDFWPCPPRQLALRLARQYSFQTAKRVLRENLHGTSVRLLYLLFGFGGSPFGLWCIRLLARIKHGA